ncbi:MAG: glycosyltransferase family 2 protein [Phycisphaerales bacterium]|nr:glycosyltransferase family 2 protein [Phycisphaerales bacterium]
MTTISVIIPAYNRATLIGATLDSVLAQTCPVSQVLVVDDGSTDNTTDVVRDYEKRSQGLIRLIPQSNAGPSVARNHGLSLCTGDFVAFLDADDLWLPTKIQKQLALLQSDPTAAGCYTQMFRFRQTLDDLGRPLTQNTLDQPGFEHVFLTMCIQSSMTLIQGNIARALQFEDQARPAEDADLLCRGSQKRHVATGSRSAHSLSAPWGSGHS